MDDGLDVVGLVLHASLRAELLNSHLSFRRFARNQEHQHQHPLSTLLGAA
jgi:hypothetical protein